VVEKELPVSLRCCGLDGARERFTELEEEVGKGGEGNMEMIKMKVSNFIAAP